MNTTKRLLIGALVGLVLSACQVGEPIIDSGEIHGGDTLAPPVFSGTTATLVASQDALIWGAAPHSTGPGTHADKNAGKNDRLEVGVYDMQTATRSLIQFDLPAGLSGADIEHAMLRITSYAWFAKHVRPDSVQVDVHRVLKSWKEGSGTGFAGQPNSSSINGVTALERHWGSAWSEELLGLNGVDASQTPLTSAGKPHNFIGHWDFVITGLVREWADNPSTNFGLLLAGKIPASSSLTEDYPQFHSRDAATADSLKPLLLITLKTPSDSTGTDSTGTDTIPVFPPPPPPTQVTPDNGATGVESPVVLTWAAVDTGIMTHNMLPTYYMLQVFTDTASIPGSLVQQDTMIFDTSWYLGLTSGTTHYWRVRAQTPHGVTAWSHIWSFTTSGSPPDPVPPPPTAPQLITPSHFATTGVSPTLSWSTTENTDWYRVQVATDTSFTTLAVNDSVHETSHTVGPLNAGTEYWWRVLALSGFGTSASGLRKFTTSE